MLMLMLMLMLQLLLRNWRRVGAGRSKFKNQCKSTGWLIRES